ncbi:hypothetical protein CY0110_18432 [Crocosphaera chwakensis CCY0110]|uniref:Uncharacterized protein n=1 Tax=Crocosphaera chwakensis CCY0110 TaxID=391612 RepID=A3IJ18_9CHRO|nr:hypothetical protein CY0110_18432 [Crocosphaera chwakensis CCY0110]
MATARTNSLTLIEPLQSNDSALLRRWDFMM